MKKVLYISGSLLPSKFANSVHVMKMCQAFAKNGIETKLTAMGGEEIDVFNFYNVENIFQICKTKIQSHNFLRFFKYNLLCFNQIKKFDGVVFLRYFYPIIWCLLFKKEIIIELHGVSNSKVINYFLRKAFKYEGLISAIFITEKLKDEYLSKFGVPREKALVLADCADIPVKVKTNTDVKEIGYVGHLYEGRGVEIIIEVAKQLVDSNFHIVGGNEEDVAKYRAMAPNNITFYGFVTQSELSEIYGNFSIALAPYQHKVSIGKAGIDTAKWMSPMKVFEYMSYKKAVIMSDLPALREVGENNKDFLYVAPNKVDEWIAAVRKFQNDNLLYNNIIENSYNLFLENYTWNGRVRRILSITN